MWITKDLNGRKTGIFRDLPDPPPPGAIEVTEAEAFSPDLMDTLDSRLAAVTALQNQKFYSDIDVVFPLIGTKTIQFRNELDRSNLRDKLMYAMSLSNQNTQVTFRTADNVTQSVAASDFVAIGQSILTAKDAIITKGFAHDDALRAIVSGVGADADKVAALLAYDITLNW